ncbi:MAG TPA: DUF983 domain-containing protein [Chitinophagales bacterium]|nr:DUF983 domain-containing protein [Chitinophagales bacterium]
MASTKSKFSVVLQNKCPRCQQGEMFVDPNPYHLNNMAKMHRNCAKCGLRFEPETGFYYGAMYLSYALGVFSSLIIFAILNFVFRIPTLWAFIIVALSWIGLSPMLFRFSRSLWLSLFTNRHRDI